MGNVISWSVDPAATNIQSFNVYRSICGTTSAVEPFVALNTYIKFQTGDHRDPQLVMLSSNDIQAIADQINTQMVGVWASVIGVSPTRSLIIRGGKDFFKVFPTQGATALGIVPGSYVPQQTFSQIATDVPFVPDAPSYSVSDPTGLPDDYYYFTTISAGIEGSPSVSFKAPNTAVPLCSINGLLLDPQGQPVCHKAVVAKVFLADVGPSETPATQPPTDNPAIVNPTEDSVFSNKILTKTYTDDQGRWQISLPQWTRVYLSIEEGNFSRIFIVPPQPYLSVGNIASDLDWRLHNDEIIVFPSDC